MKIFASLLSLTLPLVLWAGDGQSVQSKINSVTVYPSGAQVHRSASKFLSNGRQTVSFTGLETELNANSIGVSVSGGAKVLSVSSQINHLKPGAKPKRVALLSDSLEDYYFDQKFNQNMLNIYSEERAMILANKEIGWEESDFVIEDLEDLSDFYRDRLADVMLKEMELHQKQEVLAKQIKRILAQLNEINARLNQATAEILVELDVPSNSNISFEFSYMVRNAGWSPLYNIHVEEVDEPLNLAYNAQVYQSTGTDWKDVQITLTNANPNLSGTKPEIHPWQLYFVDAIEKRKVQGYSNKAYELAEGDVAFSGARLDAGTYTVDYPVNKAAISFEIKSKHSVPSNGKSQVIGIDAYEVPAEYQYYIAPKIDLTAFLLARVTDFEQFNLLPGNANLFLSNTYVGQAYINPAIVDDTLDLSLGRDQSIVVKREKIAEMTASKKIGGSKTESIGISIKIKNTKSTKVQLVVEDQVPVSIHKEIEVSVDELSGAQHAKQTGKLTWSKILLAGSAEEFVFRYQVKYPSEKKINF